MQVPAPFPAKEGKWKPHHFLLPQRMHQQHPLWCSNVPEEAALFFLLFHQKRLHRSDPEKETEIPDREAPDETHPDQAS